ncbi:MAG: glycosyltransferase family 87 protein [Myxococcota bacterium]
MRPLPRVLRRTAAGLWLASAVVLVFGGPVAMLWYFGGERLLSTVPYGGFDYDTHVSQVWRVLEGLRGWGKTWIYDVQHLAGYPNGTIFDADNKGWEAFTWALVSMGVPQGQAFNLFIITAHLLVSPVVYVSARLFGLRHNASLSAAAMAVLYWFFDSWIHWEWFVGMVAYAFASYLFLLPFAAFYRWIKERRAWQAGLCAVSMALAHLVHPYTFFLLVGPMAVLYLREARSLSRGEHAVVWGIAGVTVLFNGVWLGVALSFWHYILDSSLFADTTLDSLLWDMFGLLGDPTAMGVIGNRTGFRFTLLAGALMGLWAWWRRSDDRTAPFAVGLGILLALTYLGGYTFFANIQPHRHVGPTGFMAIIPCAGALELAWKERLWTRLSRPAIALLVVLGVPAAQHLSRDILYFTERSLPEPRPLMDGQRVYYTMLGYGPHGDFSYGRWQHDELAQWVRDHDTRRSRFLVDGWHVGEQLVWKTKAQIIGGFIWRNLEHSWANFFRLRPQGISTPAELQKYLETYAIEYVIISTPQDLAPWWDKNPLLERVKTIEHVRIYRTKAQPNLFIEGNGLIDARTNRIGVSGTDPNEDVVIRYHWLETLVCEPDCSLERVPIETDKVGFIRVPAPHPADFAIVNSYQRVADPPPLD